MLIFDVIDRFSLVNLYLIITFRHTSSFNKSKGNLKIQTATQYRVLYVYVYV